MERSIYLWSKSIMWKYPSKAPWGEADSADRWWQRGNLSHSLLCIIDGAGRGLRPVTIWDHHWALSSHWLIHLQTTALCTANWTSPLIVCPRLCVCVCVCVCVFLCEVLVYGVHWGFWIRFFSQADSSHLGRLRSLMGFIFSLLGNFCRDTQHSEWIHCSWKQLHLSRSSHAPHLSLLILSFLTQ